MQKPLKLLYLILNLGFLILSIISFVYLSHVNEGIILTSEYFQKTEVQNKLLENVLPEKRASFKLILSGMLEINSGLNEGLKIFIYITFFLTLLNSVILLYDYKIFKDISWPKH